MITTSKKTNILFIISLTLLFIVCQKTIASDKLQQFKLSQVQLLDGPFLNAQQIDLKYILALDPDRLLAPYLKDAGIKPLKDNYPNWESSGLDGHTAGHYLSALSLMYSTTGNKELLRRLNYMINWLNKCQQKNGNGYVGGIPDGHAFWKEIAAGNTEAINSRWVALYNIHKIFAGLHDAYVYTNNKRALKILVNLSDWFYELTKNLTDEQIQKILVKEHGGMNETLAQVAEITGNKKYLELAIKVSQKAILNPLIAQKNELAGKHANTQIPKVIGFKTIANATGNTDWDSAARFFWNTVVDKWSVSIGGNSVREHFHPADDFSQIIESNQGPESCNTYNMLKLTELLFNSNPDTKYMDYYERALFNHILSTQHPTKGGFVYFTQMRPRHYRVYSQSQESFWCCVGTGMENHAKYGEMIYSHDSKNLYVNLFIASKLNWKEKGIKLTQNTQFPYKDFSVLKLNLSGEKQFNLKIRKPEWTNEKDVALTLNGERLTAYTVEENYIVISRKWKKNDELKVQLPMSVKVEYLPDGSPWASVKYGPIVLAAISDSTNLDGLFADNTRWGHVANGSYYAISDAPTVITEQRDFSSSVKPVNLEHLTFSMPDVLYPENAKDLVLRPFYEIHEARYIIYWPVSNRKDFEAKKKMMAEKEKIEMEIEAKTIDQIAPGEQQPETDHNYFGEKSKSGINNSMHWRDASKWFGYDLFDKKKEATTLQITYFGLDRKRTFDIFLNDMKVETVTLNGDKGDAFYTVDYVIPEEVKKTNSGVLKLKFVAAPQSRAGGIYYIRLLK